MAKETSEQQLSVGESFIVALKSRGALGLQMLYTATPEGVVSITAMENKIPENPQPGDPIEAQYKVEALKAGTCKIIFYETQPWDKSFEPIIQKEITLEVLQ